MELFSASIPNNSQIFLRKSLFSPRFSSSTLNNRTSQTCKRAISEISIYPGFLTRLPLYKTKRFRISAQLRRPLNRRNSLRRKLIDDQKVRNNPISFDPNRSFDDNKSLRYDLDSDSVKESDYGNVAGSRSSGELESKSKNLGDSVLLSKLENWVDQYKKDAEFWGIGTGPIFTVFQDSNGNVEKILVHEDEISKRSGEFEDLTEWNLKISHAKRLAKEMQNGNNVIPKNSSVAKFVISGEQTGFFDVICGVARQPDFHSKLSRVGIAFLLGFFVLWAVKRTFSSGKQEKELTRLEKEMLRRKMKSRMEKEKLEKGSIEVIQDSPEQQMVCTKRPELDKQQLMNAILNVKPSSDRLVLPDSSSSKTTASENIDVKIQEIREMARRAREIDGENSSLLDKDEEDDLVVEEKLSNEGGAVKQHGEEALSIKDLTQTKEINAIIDVSNVEVLEDGQTNSQDLNDGESTLDLLHKREVTQDSESSHSQLCISEETSSRTKPKIILSVKEAREYLSRQRDKQEPNQEPQVSSVFEGAAIVTPKTDRESSINQTEGLDNEDEIYKHYTSGGTPDTTDVANACEESVLKRKDILSKKNDYQGEVDEYDGDDFQKPKTFQDYEAIGVSSNTGPTSVNKNNWLEKNYHEFEPLVKKIGAGFRENYTVAKEKVNQELNMNSEMKQLRMNIDDRELEWMKDDYLREIVFQVRENELAGRDPFYMMDAEDKVAFFEGLERKVEWENEKLLNLHEYVHSNIENLDYGADGISIYDPPEKFIPRWKGPPLEKNPEFLKSFVEQGNAFLARNPVTAHPANKDEVNSLPESKESPSHENHPTSSVFYDPKKKLIDGALKNSKTVIEGSDGSVRTGKKSGKEYWQHTKKWSRGFLESYNAETDPEIKSIMKDMGKNLDRWITEKEIQEAADLMTKLPERNKKFIEKKLEKLKREMELFGPQAVVSKYQEYAEDKQEDYLWWLDLPFVLCIELYTMEDGEQRIGFYSLEMAEDLELDPKQYHVIAFQDSGDCKNLCYIIQAHMDMLGNGNAFVVARPPKDAFREAKANGFGVTVIRKGELPLNVDQTLEEVEEKITEIGSKIYHDKIMRERSVDISSLMKGVFGAGKPTTRKRSKKRMLKKPHKK